MDNPGSKRIRTTNFSAFETEFLVEEVLKRANIIENKRTDAVMWREKEKAWVDLLETFNAAIGTDRTVKVLKTKYDSIKRGIKVKHNKAKAEQFRTGGGVAKITPYTPWEERLLQLISLSVMGLPSQNDCDGVATQKSRNVVNDQDQLVINNVGPLRALSNATEITYFDVEENDGFAITEATSPQMTNTSCITLDVPINAMKPISVDLTDLASPCLPTPPSSTEKAPEASNDWNSWKPKSLKAPKNKKLRDQAADVPLPSTYSTMASSRQDLINLQKEVAQQELVKLSLEIEALQKDVVQKEEEHQLRISFATRKHTAEMELMQLEKERLLK